MTDKTRDFELKFVSLTNAQTNDTFEGYVGNVFNNKFGSQSLTLYRKADANSDANYLCQVLPYCTDLKYKIFPNSIKYAVLTYKGKIKGTKFSRHSFGVDVKTLETNEKLEQFYKKILAHTETLGTPPEIPAQKKKTLLDEFEDLPF